MFSFTRTLQKNSRFFGMLLIVAGFYFCFFAYKFIKTTRILTGIALVSFLSMYLVLTHIEIPFTDKDLYFVIAMCIIIGLIVGCIIATMPIVVSAIQGGLFGFVFSELLYQAMVVTITSNPESAFWIIFTICVTYGTYLGACYPKHIFIISCCFLGAYSIARVFRMINI